MRQDNFNRDCNYLSLEDPHQQRLARLDWELKTRKSLDTEAGELEEAKNLHDNVVTRKVGRGRPGQDFNNLQDRRT